MPGFARGFERASQLKLAVCINIFSSCKCIHHVSILLGPCTATPNPPFTPIRPVVGYTGGCPETETYSAVQAGRACVLSLSLKYKTYEQRPQEIVNMSYMSSEMLPTKVIAGVTVPDTPLITKALDFAREHSTDYTYNHINRSWLLGFIIADKLPQTKERDLEVHAVAAVLHDLGFPIGHPPHSKVVSKDKRFEVDGANAARAFLKREASAQAWDQHRLQLVWDAIALHTVGGVVFHKEPEVQACAYGIWADFQGPDRVQGGVLTWDEYNTVVKV